MHRQVFYAVLLKQLLSLRLMAVPFSFRMLVALSLALFLGFSSLTGAHNAWARSGSSNKNEQQDNAASYVPKDLEDSFCELNRLLSPDARKELISGSEDDLANYHMDLGMGLRNNWRLWQGSRLAQFFNKLGIYHPDDMSSIILTSYWRHENHKPIELEKQIAFYQQYWEQAKKQEIQENHRVEEVKVKIKKMMIGFSYTPQSSCVARMPLGIQSDMRGRFLAPFRTGVFLTVRNGGRDENYYAPYFFDSADRKLHPIHISQIKRVRYSAAAENRAWFSGDTDGHAMLVAIDSAGHHEVPLPRDAPVPQLGLSDAHVLAIYPDAVFRRQEQGWETLYSGNLRLPDSGLPPRHVGDFIYFRDEGRGENEKRLWWLKLKPQALLTSIDQDIGLVGPNGPRWENSPSYCIARDGTLWATLGEGYAAKSLVCRHLDGSYGIGIFNNKLKFRGELIGSAKSTPEPSFALITAVLPVQLASPVIKESDEVSIAGLTTTPSGDIIGLGQYGIYHIIGSEIRQLLRLENTQQKIPSADGHLYDWNWDPSNVLVMADGSYFVSGTFGGIFRIAKDGKREWHFEELEAHIGSPLEW